VNRRQVRSSTLAEPVAPNENGCKAELFVSATRPLYRQPRMADYPTDADGDALRRVASDGSDMTKPMYVNFHVAVPNESAAKSVADSAYKLGYRVKTYDSPECSLPWTCECSCRMIATYDALVAIQNELRELSAQFGGHPDGWGTFGNGPNGQHPAS
jgi:regulator of RNase E activity RraB